MAGNTFGKLFSLTTAGESHGLGYVGIVDGCPPGMPLDESDLQVELDRRKPGQSRHTTQRREPDQVKILSGLFEGKTTGTPIGLLIENVDQKSKDYQKIQGKFRPGHADYTYWHKYGIRDPRGGGRASARETCMRVAAGAVAKKYLTTYYGISIYAYLSAIGPLEFDFKDRSAISKNDFFCADPSRIDEIDTYMTALRKEGESIGARINVVVSGAPVGWGEPVFDRIDADIARAMMSINAVKGVEVGDGFESAQQKGTEHRDEMDENGFRTNHAGGVLGGISTGQDMLVSIALKPTSSIRIEGDTLDTDGKSTKVSTGGRHDPCVGIRAVPIAEAMMALVLMDHCLRQRAQNPERDNRLLSN